jgi:hypothetical protein
VTFLRDIQRIPRAKLKWPYGRLSVVQSDLVSSPLWGLRSDFCSVTQLRFCRSGAPSLTTDRSVNYGVNINRTCHLHLQFCMTAFYIVSCQEPGSLWIPTIYSFTCNSSLYVHMYNVYKVLSAYVWHSRSRPNSYSSCYNGCLFSWTVVALPPPGLNIKA